MKKLLFLLLFMASCSITSNVVREPYSDIEVYFCPDDMCVEKIIGLIDSSEDIRCTFYELNLPQLIGKLREKNAHVIIEDKNALEEFDTGYSSALMHNKFCVFDENIVLTGSMNPTERGNYYNNNNIIIMESEHLSENYLDEFEELRNDIYGEGKETKNKIIFHGDIKIENYFCPEDNCKLHVINALRGANESIYFMTFSFTDEDIGNLLWNKNYLGLDVKGIMEARQAAAYSRYEDLKEFTILDNNPYTMHHKVFIIDGKIVITGSYNPTENANENNDENILIIHDEKIAEKFLREFEKLYYFEEEVIESDLIISNVVYDVPGSDEGKEYVELKNIGDGTIDLAYYFLSNNNTNSRLSGMVYPNQTTIVRPKFTLKNSNGFIILKKHNDVVDVVSWE